MLTHVLWPLLTMTLSGNPNTPDAGKPSAPPAACTAPEHRQFDFWIGDWVVTDPSGKTTLGHNRIEPILNGCALQETWTGARGVTGRSLNIYDAASKRWHQTWVDSGGTLAVFEGGLEGSAMVLRGKTAKGGVSRIRWDPQGPDRLRQVWESSEDGGKTWKTEFDGLYTRRK
jgi:hypothetical protein